MIDVLFGAVQLSTDDWWYIQIKNFIKIDKCAINVLVFYWSCVDDSCSSPTNYALPSPSWSLAQAWVRTVNSVVNTSYAESATIKSIYTSHQTELVKTKKLNKDRSKPCLFTFFHRLAQAENKCKQMDFERSLLSIFESYYRMFFF